MDYTVLFQKSLAKIGVDVQGVWNAFDVGYRQDLGWNLKLPDIEPGKFLLLHFQDFVTYNRKRLRIEELRTVEKRYGDQAHRVIVTHWNHGLEKYYNGPINLIEFSNHNYATIQDLFNPYLPEWRDILGQPKTKAWQCLNGRTCNHRRRAVDQLLNLENGTLSYGIEIPLPEWNYSTYTGTANNMNFYRLKNIYASTAVNIVTETQYDQPPGIVTEKTLYAFVAEQIPIVIGHKGIVQDCKELGFDMFEDLVDISYDSMSSNVRVEQAIQLNKDLIEGKIDLTPYRERLQDQSNFILDDYRTVMELRFMRDCEKLASKLNSK